MKHKVFVLPVDEEYPHEREFEVIITEGGVDIERPSNFLYDYDSMSFCKGQALALAESILAFYKPTPDGAEVK